MWGGRERKGKGKRDKERKKGGGKRLKNMKDRRGKTRKRKRSQKPVTGCFITLNISSMPELPANHNHCHK